MSYSVATLWVAYVVVVILSFIIFWLILSQIKDYSTTVSYGIALLLASLLGAIAVFIGTAWLDPNQLTSSDKTWLSVLFVIAFILPVFVILYIVWADQGNTSETDDCLPCKEPIKDKIYTKQTIHCDRDTGVCQVKKKKIYQGDDVTTVVYSSGEEFNQAN